MHETLDAARPIEITRGRSLPHWYQPGSTHDETMRLHDSLPKERMTRWQNHRCGWLRAHGLSVDHRRWRDAFMRLPAEHRLEYHRLFSEGLQKLLDQGLGECVLAEKNSQDILVETLHHFDGERYELGACVIMPNHTHVLLTPLGKHTLASIVRGWKSWSAKRINEARGTSGRVWQSESFDHLVRNEHKLARIRAYIEENPRHLRAGSFVYRRVAD